MCITEDKLVESYGKATPRERFRLIYKNYSIFPQLLDCYETGCLTGSTSRLNTTDGRRMMTTWV